MRPVQRKRPLPRGYLHSVAGVQPGLPANLLHLILFQKLPDLRPKLPDRFLLVILHLRPVKIHLPGPDAKARRPPHIPVHRRRLQKRLGRDAPRVHTGAAQLVLLDQGRPEPEGRRPVRRRITRRPRADDNQIILSLFHNLPLRFSLPLSERDAL